MKRMQGVVISTPDSSTAYVSVERMSVHPKYKKRMKKSKTFVADNAKGAKVDNVVSIIETRPLSKRKVWKVEEVVS